MAITALTEVRRAAEAPRRNALPAGKQPEIRNGKSQSSKAAKINTVNQRLHTLSVVALAPATSLLTIARLKNTLYDLNTFRP